MSRKHTIYNVVMYLIIISSCVVLIWILTRRNQIDSAPENVTSSILMEPDIYDSILTTMTIDKTSVDFGTIYNDTIVSTAFKLINTGKDTLRIHYINVDCIVTCGMCDTDNYPKVPAKGFTLNTSVVVTNADGQNNYLIYRRYC